MFHFVCIGWIFFRAEIHGAGLCNDRSAGSTDLRSTDFALYAGTLLAFFVAPLMVYEWYVYRQRDMSLALSPARLATRATVSAISWPW